MLAVSLVSGQGIKVSASEVIQETENNECIEEKENLKTEENKELESEEKKELKEEGSIEEQGPKQSESITAVQAEKDIESEEQVEDVERERLEEEKGIATTEEQTINSDEIMPDEDIEDELITYTGDIANGVSGNITWVINADGKLTLNGTGDLDGVVGPKDIPWGSYLESITSAEVNVTDMTTMSYLFSGLTNLKSVNLQNLDTTNVMDMSAMFRDCNSLEELDLSYFDTANVANMKEMFCGCNSLEELDLGSFNTANVTDMYGLFDGCNNLKSINLSSFDTTNVINMSAMFRDCNSLEQLDLSSFDTANVTEMWELFHCCSSLRTINLNSFDITNVLDMRYMFHVCSSLEELDLSSFNTANVTNMEGLFGNCSNLKTINLNSFDTTNVINMREMFINCKSLETINLNGFNTAKVTDMQMMFDGCVSLTRLDLSNFITTGVTNMEGMFGACRNLTEIDLSSFDTTNVTNMEEMFGYCRNLEHLDLSSFNAENVIDAKNIFYACDNLVSVHTPYNITTSFELPSGSDIIWLLPDGTEITELPKNLDHSITAIRRKNPKIITTTTDLNMSDVIRVKYVPYSYTIMTDNWEDDNIVTYSIVSGELAEGLMLYSATGEIYGVPLETGEFPITVKAEFSNQEYMPSYADLTLTVLDNTDNNIFGASDPGYEVEQYIGTQQFAAPGSSEYYYTLTEKADQLFVSAGEYREFINLWLNGKKLIEGEDYTKESGSTRITVRRQTFENKTNKDGINTIAAEFRTGGNVNNALKRTAQNFWIDLKQGSNSGNRSHSGRGSSSEERTITVSSATAVVRLVDEAGNPLSGAIMELHSTPQTAQTDKKGRAVFSGVTAGLHTLYVKDGAGNIQASRKLELLFGEKDSINADQVTVRTGETFTLQIQLMGNELLFLNVQEGDIYQVVSAGTGDDMEPELWLAILLVSCGLSCGIYAGYRRKTY